MESDENKDVAALCDDAERWLVGFKAKPEPPGEMTQWLVIAGKRIEKKARWKKRWLVLVAVVYTIVAIILKLSEVRP